MNRDELNEIYKELEKRMHRIVVPFTSLHRGFDFSCGYFSGHYHKNSEDKVLVNEGKEKGGIKRGVAEII